mgnify:CR=1 FL=1
MFSLSSSFAARSNLSLSSLLKCIISFPLVASSSKREHLVFHSSISLPFASSCWRKFWLSVYQSNCYFIFRFISYSLFLKAWISYSRALKSSFKRFNSLASRVTLFSSSVTTFSLFLSSMNYISYLWQRCL